MSAMHGHRLAERFAAPVTAWVLGTKARGQSAVAESVVTCGRVVACQVCGGGRLGLHGLECGCTEGLLRRAPDRFTTSV